MESADIATLIERCAPSALAKPVAAIILQASEFEPLLVTIAGKRPIRILAGSKPEAIALASEATMAGQHVRIGLAQLGDEDLKAAGLTVTTAFEPCPHIAGVGRVFHERKTQLVARGASDEAAGEQAIASFKFVRNAGTAPRKPSPEADRQHAASSQQEQNASAKDPPSWSVYGAHRGASLLIYSR